jgi:hypothetical protein
MKKIFLLSLLLIVFACYSCKKYLDVIPDKALTTPVTLNEFQQLLDQDLIGLNSGPGFGDIGSDDIYLSDTNFPNFDRGIQNVYTWSTSTTDAYNNFYQDWSTPYHGIFYANAVLDGIAKARIGLGDQAAWNAVQGSALFYRAFNFFQLEEAFGQPYKPSSAAKDMGIVLRLTADLNQKSIRSTVQAVYDQIEKDLLLAAKLVPAAVNSSTPNRVNKPAVMAMLARIYLQKQDYVNARKYADSCLLMFNKLTDYNTIDTTQTYPFAPMGPGEVLYNSTELSYSNFPVSADLFNSYNINDLRKKVFYTFDGNDYFFIGSYDGSYNYFNGLATDEVYLIRAECAARMGDQAVALQDLNTLLIKRWKAGTFVPVTASDSEDCLLKVLAERRKELVLRGLRWLDLRRLNQDPHFAVVLTRVVNGKVFNLPPDDPRYTALIPESEIKISGIPQNPR